MIDNISQTIYATNTNQAIISGTFVLLGALIATLSAIIVAYCTYKWGIKKDIELKNRENKQKVYSELMGMRLVMSQLYLSRFEAYVHSDYYEFRHKLTKDPIDLSEAMRLMLKSEDYIIEIMKSNQKLFEMLGLIKLLFPNSPELDELIKKVRDFKVPTILKRPTNEMSICQLEDWKDIAIKELNEITEREYKQYIDNLLEHLYKFSK